MALRESSEKIYTPDKIAFFERQRKVTVEQALAGGAQLLFIPEQIEQAEKEDPKLRLAEAKQKIVDYVKNADAFQRGVLEAYAQGIMMKGRFNDPDNPDYHNLGLMDDIANYYQWLRSNPDTKFRWEYDIDIGGTVEDLLSAEQVVNRREFSGPVRNRVDGAMVTVFDGGEHEPTHSEAYGRAQHKVAKWLSNLINPQGSAAKVS